MATTLRLDLTFVFAVDFETVFKLDLALTFAPDFAAALTAFCFWILLVLLAFGEPRTVGAAWATLVLDTVTNITEKTNARTK